MLRHRHPIVSGGHHRTLGRALAALAAAIFCLASGSGRAADVRQAYLIQNSGWMEPFLLDPKSSFRPLVTALVEATRLEGVDIAVASFNQDGQVAGEGSPRTLFEGAYSAERVAAVVRDLALPTKKGTRDRYPDADFNGALIGTIKGPLKGGEGVIWMVTNNKNAPGNDPDVLRNTQKFYRELRDSAAIARIVAYPVRMAVKGPKFESGGLLIYGIAYGETGGRALDAILAAGNPIHKLFEFPPVSLKPVQDAPVTLRFEDIETGEGVRTTVRDGTLVVSGADAADGTSLRLRGRLRNTFYPQRIVSAEIELAWTEIGSAETAQARASVVPSTVRDVAPQGDSAAFAVDLGIPPIARPPGLSGLLADARTVDGTLAIRLKQLRLDLDPDFLNRIEPIFGGRDLTGGQARTIDSQLPDIFFDFQKISETATTLPVRIEATYSSWPMIGLGAAGISLLAVALLAGILATAARTQTVKLGQHAKQVRLKPFRAATVHAPDGTRWQVRRGLFGKASAMPLGQRSET